MQRAKSSKKTTTKRCEGEDYLLLSMYADLDYNLPNSKLPLTFVKLLTINFNWLIIFLFASIFF